jgi:hypothetical protein
MMKMNSFAMNQLLQCVQYRYWYRYYDGVVPVVLARWLWSLS